MFKWFSAAIFIWMLHSRAHLESHFGSVDLSVAPPSQVVTNDETPVNHGEVAGAEVVSGERPWRAPDFTNQARSLGYDPKVFQAPKGLERPVQFWVDVYSKYSTLQGVIHDSEWIDLVYEIVDFSEVEKNTRLTPREKEKLKRKMVNEAKERASETLSRLDRITDPTSLVGQDRRIWDYMTRIDSKSKFREANEKNRIRFQLGQSDRMKSAIFFSGRYLEEFEEIFREANLPIELTRLVFVESSFNVLARSKVGASGLWQIMPSVARPLRMISPTVDRRNDPWDATRLAARVLSGNYRLLGEWPLAITGYNHGPNGVKKMVDKYGTRDLVDLIQNVRSRKSFGFASRNFYPSFLAALEVEKNASKYFPDIKWSEKLNFIPYKIPSPLAYNELTKAFEERGQVEIFNPHLTYRVKNSKGRIPAGTKLYIPAEKISMFDKNATPRRVAVEVDAAEKVNPSEPR